MSFLTPAQTAEILAASSINTKRDAAARKEAAAIAAQTPKPPKNVVTVDDHTTWPESAAAWSARLVPPVKVDPKKPNPATEAAKKVASDQRALIAGGVDIAVKLGTGQASDITLDQVTEVVTAGSKLAGNTAVHNQVTGGLAIIGQAKAVYGGEPVDWGAVAVGVVGVSGSKGQTAGLIKIVGTVADTGEFPSKGIYNHITNDNTSNPKSIALKNLEITVAHGIENGNPDLVLIEYYSKKAAGQGNDQQALAIQTKALEWSKASKIDYDELLEASVTAGGDTKQPFYLEVIKQARNGVAGKPVTYQGITKSAITAYGGEYGKTAAQAVDLAFKYAESGDLDIEKIADIVVAATKTDSDTVDIVNGVYKYLQSDGEIKDLVNGFANKALDKYGVDVDAIYDTLDTVINGDPLADPGGLVSDLVSIAGIKTDVDIEQAYSIAEQLVTTGTLNTADVAEFISDNTGIDITQGQITAIGDALATGNGYDLTDSAVAVLGQSLGVDLSWVDTDAVTDYIGGAVGDLLDGRGLTEVFSEIFDGDIDWAGAVDGVLGIEGGSAKDLMMYMSGDGEYAAALDSILDGSLELGDLGDLLGDEGILGLMSAFGSKDDYAPPPCLDQNPPNTRSGFDSLSADQKEKLKGSNWEVKSSHDKIYHEHWGQDNGEPNSFDLQFDRSSGDFSIWNSGKQFLKFDWAALKIVIKSPKCVLIESTAVTIDAPNTYITGNLKVYGHTKILKTLNVKDHTLLENKLRVLNDTLLEEKLTVENDSLLEAKLTVEGKSTLEDDVLMEKDLDLLKDARLFGDATIIKLFTALGGTALGGGGTISGPLVSTGVVTAKEFIKT